MGEGRWQLRDNRFLLPHLRGAAQLQRPLPPCGPPQLPRVPPQPHKLGLIRWLRAGSGAKLLGSLSRTHLASPEARARRLSCCLLPSRGAPGCQGTARASLREPETGSLTCVLGAGQGESQGPERGQLPPAGTHPAEGGEKSRGTAAEEGPERAGTFCSLRSGSGPSGSTWVGGARPANPLAQVNSGHSLGAGQQPETGRDGRGRRVGPGFPRAPQGPSPEESSRRAPPPCSFPGHTSAQPGPRAPAAWKRTSPFWRGAQRAAPPEARPCPTGQPPARCCPGPCLLSSRQAAGSPRPAWVTCGLVAVRGGCVCTHWAGSHPLA